MSLTVDNIDSTGTQGDARSATVAPWIKKSSRHRRRGNDPRDPQWLNAPARERHTYVWWRGGQSSSSQVCFLLHDTLLLHAAYYHHVSNAHVPRKIRDCMRPRPLIISHFISRCAYFRFLGSDADPAKQSRHRTTVITGAWSTKSWKAKTWQQPTVVPLPH